MLQACFTGHHTVEADIPSTAKTIAGGGGEAARVWLSCGSTVARPLIPPARSELVGQLIS
jgi:hypothetical protein